MRGHTKIRLLKRKDIPYLIKCKVEMVSPVIRLESYKESGIKQKGIIVDVYALPIRLLCAHGYV